MKKKDIFSYIIPRPQNIKIQNRSISKKDFIAMNPIPSIDKELSEEEYILEITPDFISIRGGSERALFYAGETINKITQISCKNIPCAVIHDYPDLEFRGTHLAFWGGKTATPLAPRFSEIKKVINQIASWKNNYLVLECPNVLPWKRHPICRDKNGWNDNHIEELKALTKNNHIQLIPLVQTLGHLDCFLNYDEHIQYRDTSDDIYKICPQDDKNINFIKDFLLDVFEMFPNSQYIHIGGDEVNTVSCCNECKNHIEQDKYSDLYCSYYNQLIDWIIEQGKIPMIWGDMLIKHPEAINKLSRDVIIVDWMYDLEDSDYRYGTMNEIPSNHDKLKIRQDFFSKYWHDSPKNRMYKEYPYVKFFTDYGFTVIGGSLSHEEYCSAPTMCPEAGIISNRRFANAIKKSNQYGLLNTTWIGISPLENSYPGFAAGAEYSWNNNVNDTIENFMSRFFQDFTGEEKNSNILMQINDFTRRRMGFQSTPWKDIDVSYIPMSSKSMKGSKYIEIQNWGRKALTLQSKVQKHFNYIDSLFLTNKQTEYNPIDLADFYNDDCYCVTAPYSPLRPPAGLHEMLNITFNFADKKLIVLKKDVKINNISISPDTERLYFGVSGFTFTDIGKQLHMADVKINYEDNSTRLVPFICNKNIASWDIVPSVYIYNKYMPTEMWPGYCYYLNAVFANYIDLEKNKKIKSIDLISRAIKKDMDYVLIYAITEAKNLTFPDISYDRLEQIKDALNKCKDHAKEINSLLPAIYKETIEESAKIFPTILDRLLLLIDIYLEKITKL